MLGEACVSRILYFIVLGEFHYVIFVDYDDSHKIFASITNDHGIIDVRAEFELVLDILRGDVFTARGDNQILLAVRNLYKPIGINFSHIAGVQPAGFQLLGCRLGIIEIPLEDISSAKTYFPVFSDLYFYAGERLTDGSDLHPVPLVGAGNAGSLRLSIAFAQRNTDALEKPQNVGRNGRGPGKGQANPIESQTFFQFAEAEKMGQSIRQPQAKGDRLVARFKQGE